MIHIISFSSRNWTGTETEKWLRTRTTLVRVRMTGFLSSNGYQWTIRRQVQVGNCSGKSCSSFAVVSILHLCLHAVLKALHFDKDILTGKECSDCATKERDWYQLTAIIIATKTQKRVKQTLDVVRKQSAVKDYDLTELVRLLQGRRQHGTDT